MACHHRAAFSYPSPSQPLTKNTRGVPFVAVEKKFALPEEEALIDHGILLANDVMATPCFAEYLLAASLTESNPNEPARDAWSPKKVWDFLVSRQVTVNVAMFSGSLKQNHVWHTIGLEDDASPGVVQMNRYYVKTAYMVADNVIHEAEGHLQGFRHNYYKPTSVPYTLNAAFEKCAAYAKQPLD